MSHRRLADAISVACRAPDNHPFRVAEQALRDSLGDQGLLVALLHDSVEDGYLSERELARTFPPWVSDALEALTHKESETYFEYINRVAEGPEIARQVKLSDLRVNIARSIESGHPSLKNRYERAIEKLEGVG